MGFFNKLFGKKETAAAPNRSEDEDDLRSTRTQPIHGPPEFLWAVDLQRKYWTYSLEEQSELESRGIDQLSWRDLLRFHHLCCLQRLTTGPDRAMAAEKCHSTLRRLLAQDSPYRPRPAMIWQGQAAQTGINREPDMQGDFLNPSLTHLGCLEIYRVDAANQPTGMDFVSFDDLAGALFAPSKLIRAAKLFYSDGPEEIVLVPLLYGLTWEIGDEYDRDGRMTKFVAHLEGEEVGRLGASGMGVGQQDFSICNQEGGSRLFGIGSVAEIAFPLDIRDPRFDEKARARGMDPDHIRRQMGNPG